MITIATLTIISNFILMHQAIKLNNQRKIIEKQLNKTLWHK